MIVLHVPNQVGRDKKWHRKLWPVQYTPPRDKMQLITIILNFQINQKQYQRCDSKGVA